MYQASHADSCVLMMCALCLLGLTFTLPRAIANASIILTLHTIAIVRPAHACESISPREGSKLTIEQELTPIAWRLTPTPGRKVLHNGMVRPSSKRRSCHVRQGNPVQHSSREPRARTP
jgi:hypothetical protein